MLKSIAITGNEGLKVRSDCSVKLELNDSGKTEIVLNSKVKALFGKSIKELLENILEFFEIDSCKVEINDKGALPFVIGARLEAAIKQVKKTDKNYLFPVISENQYTTEKNTFRFTRLYLPGNNPSMMLNAGLHSPDGIILDLEDSVAPNKKDEARLLVRNALCQVNFYGAERMVRINQGEMGFEDLYFIIPHNVNLILVPKCESADYIHKLEEKITFVKDHFGIKTPIYLMPIIESALGVEKAFEIANASENVCSLAIGLEDFTADLGTKRTESAEESLYARQRIINACKASGIQAIDSVYSDVGNMDGLRENVKTSRSLGFEGMGCIHPRQIPVITECFAPTTEELDKAKEIINAAHIAEAKGLGVISIGTKMIDPPVVKRAETTTKLAISLGLLNENWEESYGN